MTSTRSERSELKRQAEKERIATVAHNLFRERGFDAVVIEEIAAAAGISRRTFFNYFDSKSDAFWDHPTFTLANLAPLVRQARTAPDPWDAILHALIAWSSIFTADSRVFVHAYYSIGRESPVLMAQTSPYTRQLSQEVEYALACDRATDLGSILIQAAAKSTADTLVMLVAEWAAQECDGEMGVLIDRVFRPLFDAFSCSILKVSAVPAAVV